MAQENEAPAAAAPQAATGRAAWVVMGIVALVSAAAGFAVPYFLIRPAAKSDAEPPHVEKASKKQHEMQPTAYVPFGDVVANLDDHRMMRYVRAKFSLAVDPKESQAVQHLVDENKL